MTGRRPTPAELDEWAEQAAWEAEQDHQRQLDDEDALAAWQEDQEW